MEVQIVELVDTILASAIAKGASQIRIRGATVERPTVEFAYSSSPYRLDAQEELRPPGLVLTFMVRRLSVMASLPIYPRGGSAAGKLVFAGATFDIRVSGHGDSLQAELRVAQLAG